MSAKHKGLVVNTPNPESTGRNMLSSAEIQAFSDELEASETPIKQY
jgi:hypothetical protein